MTEFAAGSDTPGNILSGFTSPAALLIDGSGNLYVADTTAGTVSEFAPGAATPSVVITGLSNPKAMALDGAGNLYVANNGSSTVSKFAPGATTASATLTGMFAPQALAFDGSGNLYVVDFDDQVMKFAPGATSPTATLTGVDFPVAIAVDVAGNVYVANFFADTVSKFAPGANTPTLTLTGLNEPQALAFDANGNLFVANSGNDSVSEFATAAGIPATTSVTIRSSLGIRPMALGGTNNAAVQGINLTSAELACILTTPTGTITVGDSNQTGNILINSATLATTPGAATVVTQAIAGGGAIALADGTSTDLNGNGGTVTLAAGTGGILATLSATNVGITTNGFTATGQTLNLNLAFAPTPSTQLMVINNTGSSPISGTFSNLPQGGTYTTTYLGTSYTFQANYLGGNGNDLVLTAQSTVPAFSSFLVTSLASTSVSAGSAFLVTVQTADANGHVVPTTYSGSVALTSNDPQVPTLPAVTMTNGFGFFIAILKSAGPRTLTAMAGGATGTSANITIIPASANYFTVMAPANATTGSAFNLTVTALDAYGNVATGYNGTVRLTSTDPTLAVSANNYAFTTGPGKDNGVHTFSATLNTAGSQTITAADTVSTNPNVAGTSQAIITHGLSVASFTPFTDGFTVAFNKPFLPLAVTLYGPTANTPAAVVMTGAGIGAIHGTLLLDPSNLFLTFKATANYLVLLNSLHSGNNSVVLPDATYTVKLLSGSGNNGFLDGLGTGLDGATMPATSTLSPPSRPITRRMPHRSWAFPTSHAARTATRRLWCPTRVPPAFRLRSTIPPT